jgi:hypothetical protein
VTIDNINTMTIYVDKEPPTYKAHHLEYAGEIVDGIPFSNGEPPKGTRVYVDGVMAGFVKRKLLGSDLLSAESTEAEPLYSLQGYLKSLGIDADQAKAIDFVEQDDLLARFDPKAWSAQKDALVFKNARHAHGKVAVRFDSGKSAPVTSIQVFVHKAPPARVIDTEAMDQASGSLDDRDETGPGSGSGQARGMNGDSADDE